MGAAARARDDEVASFRCYQDLIFGYWVCLFQKEQTAQLHQEPLLPSTEWRNASIQFDSILSDKQANATNSATLVHTFRDKSSQQSKPEHGICTSTFRTGCYPCQLPTCKILLCSLSHVQQSIFSFDVSWNSTSTAPRHHMTRNCTFSTTCYVLSSSSSWLPPLNGLHIAYSSGSSERHPLWVSCEQHELQSWNATTEGPFTH